MSVSTSQVLPVRDSGQVLAPFVWQRFGGLHLVTVAGPLSVACILQRDDGAWAESGTHRLFVPTGSARAMEHAQEASTWAREPSDAAAAAALVGRERRGMYSTWQMLEHPHVCPARWRLMGGGGGEALDAQKRAGVR